MENNLRDRIIEIERTFNAPIDLVWEVWTNPEHLKHWWGPNDFTNSISKMEVQPGGAWNLIMHGPDGTDYRNESIFTEVIPYKKLVYDHITGPKFTATVEFESRGNTTHIRWQMLFRSKEALIQTVKTFNAAEGLKQNVARLEVYMSAKQQLLKT